MMKVMGVPVVLPLNTPLTILTLSASRLAVKVYRLTSELHLMCDEILINRYTGCYAVENGADSLTVALAEDGDGNAGTEGVFHIYISSGLYKVPNSVKTPAEHL